MNPAGRGRGGIGVRLNFVRHALEREVGVGKDLTGLLFEGLQFFIFGAEMADEQALHAGLEGDCRRLGGRAVKTPPGLDFEVF